MVGVVFALARCSRQSPISQACFARHGLALANRSTIALAHAQRRHERGERGLGAAAQESVAHDMPANALAASCPGPHAPALAQAARPASGQIAGLVGRPLRARTATDLTRSRHSSLPERRADAHSRHRSGRRARSARSAAMSARRSGRARSRALGLGVARRLRHAPADTAAGSSLAGARPEQAQADGDRHLAAARLSVPATQSPLPPRRNTGPRPRPRSCRSRARRGVRRPQHGAVIAADQCVGASAAPPSAHRSRPDADEAALPWRAAQPSRNRLHALRAVGRNRPAHVTAQCAACCAPITRGTA